MPNLRRRMIAPVLAATVAVAPALLAAAPASAAAPSTAAEPSAAAASRVGAAALDQIYPSVVSVTSAKISPASVTLRSTDGCGVRAHLTATLSGPLPTENVFFSGVGADYYVGGTLYDYTLLWNTGGNTWEGDLTLCGKDPAGAYKLELSAAYATGTGIDDPDATLHQSNIRTLGFSVKRPSAVTLNAAPEPVRKGATLTAKGKLTSDGRALANTKVQVWFKADGASGYTLKGTARTNSSGAYAATFKARTSGTWKVVAPGTQTRNEAVAYDAVKVKK